MAVDLTRTNLKSLGARMFIGCSSITEINCSGTDITSIPGGRTSTGNTSYNAISYGNDGFTEGCTSLETINFSNCSKLTSIGHGAFGISSSDDRRRTSLKEINFRDCIKLKTLGNYSFAGTPNAETVDFTNCPIEEILEGTFNNCKAKNWIIDFSNVVEIFAEAFNAAGADDAIPIDVIAPKIRQWGYDYHGGGMFYHCNMIKSFDMTGVEDMNDVKWQYIPHRMFTQCKNLISVNLGNVPFRFIGGSAFKDTSALKNLSFNTSKIEYIGSYPWASPTSPADQWSENCYHAFLGAGAADCTPIDITIDDGLLKWIYNYSFGNGTSNGCKIVSSITCHNCNNFTNWRGTGVAYSTSMKKLDFTGSKLNVNTGHFFNLPNLEDLRLGFADDYAPTAGFSNNIGSSKNLTIHLAAADADKLKNAAKTIEDTLSNANLKFWCCSNGNTSTTTGGTSGSISCNVNSFYGSGTPTILFDL